MSSEPTRRDKILIGLRLAFALTEEEAVQMLRMYDVDRTGQIRQEILDVPEPKVWSAPLKWWRRGRDVALSKVCSEFFFAMEINKEYDERGYKIHGKSVRGPHERHRPSARAEDRGGAADRG